MQGQKTLPCEGLTALSCKEHSAYFIMALAVRVALLPDTLTRKTPLPCEVGCSKSRKNPMLKLRDFGLVKLLEFNA